MPEPLVVFISQFVAIFLLGIQSRNVNLKQYVPAAITSFLLGVTGFIVTGIVAKVYMDFSSNGVTPTLIAFLLAGPLGICTSIWAHPILTRKRENEG
jgi:cation transporter-like permease